MRSKIDLKAVQKMVSGVLILMLSFIQFGLLVPVVAAEDAPPTIGAILGLTPEMGWTRLGADLDAFPLGSEAVTTIDDPQTAQPVDFTTTGYWRLDDFNPGDMAIYQWWHKEYTIKAGDFVSITSGSAVKTGTVLDFRVTGFDVDLDHIYGVGLPGGRATVAANSPAGLVWLRNIPIDQDGHWIANYGDQGNGQILVDLVPGSNGISLSAGGGFNYQYNWWIPVSTEAIGPEGGEISTEDNGLVVEIPQGALDEVETVSIVAREVGCQEMTPYWTTSPHLYDYVSSYSLQPYELVFNQSSLFTFHWNDQDNDGMVDGTQLEEADLIVVNGGEVMTPACAENPSCDPLDNSVSVMVANPFQISLVTPVTNTPPEVQNINIPIQPEAVGTTINVTASFADLDTNDSHTALWEWGDGTTSAGTVDEENQTVGGSHAYSTAGVYTIKVTVTDSAGTSGELALGYLVIYDPEDGFVTGGGWINSPAGAYLADASLVGKATFGFVSRYQKGANIPTGNTEFQFKVADLNFSSTAYAWLVVAGAKAQYKGVGTINRAGSYGFMLTAIDGQINGGGGVDKFRIKIWDLVSGEKIYDNQLGAADDALPVTALQGGSIVIHK